jgi:class 3 adenylate cyclase
VLIADLANFTRLSAGRDPEDTQRMLARYFEAIDPIVLQHGGTIDKHMGDAMMALVRRAGRPRRRCAARGSRRHRHPSPAG